MDKFLEIKEWVDNHKELLAYILAAIGMTLAFISFKDFGTFDEARAYKENYKNIVEIKVDDYKKTINQPVYATGELSPVSAIKDSFFVVSTDGIELSRVVKTYQWEETKDGDSSASYEKTWSEKIIDSSKFNDVKKVNKKSGFKSEVVTSEILMGKAKVSPELVLPELEMSRQNVIIPSTVAMMDYGISKASPSELYFGEDIENPKIGDQKISFTVIPRQKVTIAGALTDEKIVPYEKYGNKLFWVKSGVILPSSLLSSVNQKIYFNFTGSIIGLVVLMLSAFMYREKLLSVIDLYEEYSRIVFHGIMEKVLKGEYTLPIVVGFLGWIIPSAASFFVFV